MSEPGLRTTTECLCGPRLWGSLSEERPITQSFFNPGPPEFDSYQTDLLNSAVLQHRESSGAAPAQLLYMTVHNDGGNECLLLIANSSEDVSKRRHLYHLKTICKETHLH